MMSDPTVNVDRYERELLKRIKGIESAVGKLAQRADANDKRLNALASSRDHWLEKSKSC